MREATFRSSTPHSCLNVIYPVYADVNRGIESEFNGKGKQVFIGTAIAVYCFCEEQVVTRLLLQLKRILLE